MLSGGEQQMVAFGRALMADPDVLVVDELSLGLAPLVIADLAAHLVELNAEHGLAVLLIEQNARLALRPVPAGLRAGGRPAWWPRDACAELADRPARWPAPTSASGRSRR